MDKKLVLGGIVLGLGVLLFVNYNKNKKIFDCKKKLDNQLSTLKPTDDFDIEGYKKQFMEKCLKGEI